MMSSVESSLDLSKVGNIDRPNKAMIRKLAKEWYRLSPEEQLKLRALRCKRGIRCHICGMNGYYRECCPNQCESPPPTPDSDASTPPASPRKQKQQVHNFKYYFPFTMYNTFFKKLPIAGWHQYVVDNKLW